MRSKIVRQLTTVGEDFGNEAAGTTADILVYQRDQADNIIFASGIDVPVDTTSGYAKGCIFIDRDVATGISGVYENVGTATSCNFDSLTATTAEINSVCDGNTATAAEIVQAADLSEQQGMVVGSGFAGSGTIYESLTVKHGAIFKTEIIIDMTDVVALSGDTMILGQTSGIANIGQNLTLLSGTLLGGRMTCLEVPAGASDDVDLYSAVEGDALAGVVITDSDETALLTKGGAWSAGDITIMSALPAANEYLYLTAGKDDDGTYSAGRFLIELWGI